MFLDESLPLMRTLIMGILAFILVIFVLRVSGKRTLSKMNSFDFIVTIALGSILANIMTSTSLPLVNGILAFALLVFLQYLVTWLSVRSKTFLSLIKSQPKMLYYDGQFDELQLKKERMSYAEIMQAVREEGIGSLDDVAVVVLETDGTLSIIESPINGKGKQSSLSNLDIEE